jgi:hypothetical protein
VRVFRLGLLIAAVSALIPAAAQAAGSQPSETPAALYNCQARDPDAADPPPPPQLPPSVAANLDKAVASNDFKRLCPVGEVPQPTATAASPKVLPPKAATADQAGARISRRRGGRVRGARASRWASPNGFWYSWAYGAQSFTAKNNLNGFWVSQTNEQPYIPYSENLAGAHSLGQLWAINEEGAGCESTVETGWSESAGQFGDVSPHLFIYASDCGAGLGYAGSGLPWVQSSPYVFPNAVLTHNDVFHAYAARLAGNNWWIYYDGQWVGYIPNYAWTSHFPGVIKEIVAGGEVATPTYATCADMGYGGLFGGHPWAAMFEHTWYEYNWSANAATASLFSNASDPSYYATGNWSPGNPGTQFRYGGPGWC